MNGSRDASGSRSPPPPRASSSSLPPRLLLRLPHCAAALPHGSALLLLALLALPAARDAAQDRVDDGGGYEDEEGEAVEEGEGVLPSPGQRQGSCPSSCTCSPDGAVECAGAGLDSFPASLPADTQLLSLQNNQIEVVPIAALKRVPLLRTLNLQNNLITSAGLPADGFMVLKELQYLYLANNKLTQTPGSLPASLVSADLAANFLTAISPGTFGGKPDLRSVYLHNNRLTNVGIPRDAFLGSDAVETLILSSNSLTRAPLGLPPALQRLHLRNNKLHSLSGGAFDQLRDLRELYLQHNQLNDRSVDAKTFTHSRRLEYLDLSSNNLTLVPRGLPARLVILHLERNAIAALDSQGLGRLRSLEYLLVHSNRVRAHAVGAAAFRNLRRLHTLHLYSNELNRVPRSLPAHIKVLMLLHNTIHEIRAQDFAATPELAELNLSFNRLSTKRLHPRAFTRLSKLASLDLTGNQLTHVPVGLPASLEVLRIQQNHVAVLGNGALSGLPALRELMLSDNALASKTIAPNIWAQLPSLTTLDLSSNALTVVPSSLPASLEYLYLQNNRINSIPEGAFSTTPNIKGIFLRYNRLPPHVKDMFMGLEELQVLDLTGNFDGTPEPGADDGEGGDGEGGDGDEEEGMGNPQKELPQRRRAVERGTSVPRPQKT
ncbi:podocan isoform X2 [Petromyzon marinus]|uniref:podocan isoform X2 n=1 Tax=Petromyzon marinus TaxID=7757 RepID=UPI003F7006DA